MAEKNIIEAIQKFIKETHASDEDILVAIKRLQEGYPLNKIITRWKKKEAEIGKHAAKTDYRRVLKMDDCIDDMRHDLLHGKEKGTTTHIEGLDRAWTWRLGEFNIWTGYSNEGKSLFLRFIALIKAITEGWKFAFYAPEDYPAKEFFDDIIHSAAGYSTDKENINFIGEELYMQMFERLKDLFYFVYLPPPDNELLHILKEFVPLIQNEGIKSCVIDPIIKLVRPKEYMNADDKYAAYVTTLCTDFSRQYNVSLNLVMHQLTPRLQENDLYHKPSMYNIKGGGTWADGTDNILSIWRPLYARDKVDDEVIFTSQKIKKQKLVGIPQDFHMRFDRKKNRYMDSNNKHDLFNFDEYLRVARIKLLFP